jgi:hypothetical protein
MAVDLDSNPSDTILNIGVDGRSVTVNSPVKKVADASK